MTKKRRNKSDKYNAAEKAVRDAYVDRGLDYSFPKRIPQGDRHPTLLMHAASKRYRTLKPRTTYDARGGKPTLWATPSEESVNTFASLGNLKTKHGLVRTAANQALGKHTPGFLRPRAYVHYVDPKHFSYSVIRPEWIEEAGYASEHKTKPVGGYWIRQKAGRGNMESTFLGASAAHGDSWERWNPKVDPQNLRTGAKVVAGGALAGYVGHEAYKHRSQIRDTMVMAKAHPKTAIGKADSGIRHQLRSDIRGGLSKATRGKVNIAPVYEPASQDFADRHPIVHKNLISGAIVAAGVLGSSGGGGGGVQEGASLRHTAPIALSAGAAAVAGGTIWGLAQEHKNLYYYRVQNGKRIRVKNSQRKRVARRK